MKETTRKTRCGRKKNLEMDLRETGWGGVYWIAAAQDRDHWRTFVNIVMNLRVQ
jgi:hypothetical protein